MRGLEKVEAVCILYIIIRKKNEWRVHVFKLTSQTVGWMLGNTFFSQRVTHEWNKLLSEVVTATSMNNF